MTRPEILAKLRALMKRSSQADVNWDNVNEQAAIESLGFDSLSILDLIYDIQQEFGLDFEPQKLVGVKTVGELAAFLEQSGAR
jgi:acyl carrier protein